MDHLNKPIPAPVKMGDVVFFQQFKKSIVYGAPEIRCQGNMFGVVLGEVPPTSKREPTPQDLLQAMGAVGFILFDDVLEILGQEHEAKLITEFQKKYQTEVIPPPEPEPSKIIQPEPPTPLKIV